MIQWCYNNFLLSRIIYIGVTTEEKCVLEVRKISINPSSTLVCWTNLNYTITGGWISQDAVSETNISLQVLIVGNSEMNSGVREEAEMGSRGIEH